MARAGHGFIALSRAKEKPRGARLFGFFGAVFLTHRAFRLDGFRDALAVGDGSDCGGC